MVWLSHPAVFIATLALLGAVAGAIAGLFGVGGGMIIIPVLVFLYKSSGVASDAAIHGAMGVSLMTIVATSFASYRTHAKHNAIEHSVVRIWAPAVIIGSLSGSLLATQMSGAFLSLIFSAFLAAMAVFLGLVPANWHSLKTVPQPFTKRIIAFVIGFFSALVGIGGGTLTVPALVLCRKPIHRAIGTASVIGLLISLPASLVFLGAQIMKNQAGVFEGDHPVLSNVLHLDLLSFAVLVPITMLAAPVGARFAHRLPAGKLRRVFALLLAVIAIKMFLTAQKM